MKTTKIHVLAPKEIKAAAGEDESFDEYLRTGAAIANLTVEDYARQVSVLFRCTELRADTLAGMPRQIQNLQTGEVLAMENAAGLREDGSPIPSEAELFGNLGAAVDLTDLLWRIEAAQVLLGKSYLLLQRNRVKLKGARWLDPSRVKPEYGQQGITTFTYERILGTAYAGRDNLSPDDVCVIWRRSLRELEPGPAPAESACLSANIVYNGDMFMKVFFERGAMPVVLVMSEEDPNQEERNRIKMFLSQMIRGVRNAFNFEVIGAALKFEKLTPPIKDMDFTRLTDTNQRKICVSLGVPFSLVFSGDSNYSSSSDNDNLHFYEKLMVPEARFVAHQLNVQILHRLGLSLVFRSDLLEVFQEKELAKAERAIQLFDRQVIDEDELRVAAGYTPRGLIGTGKPQPLTPAGEKKPAAVEPPPAPKRKEEPEDDEEDEEDEEEAKRLTDLDKWQRKVLKALKNGRSPGEVKFNSDWLSSWEVEAIEHSLKAAGTAEEVKAVFALPFFLSR
jgi:phage portal protein BeeE